MESQSRHTQHSNWWVIPESRLITLDYRELCWKHTKHQEVHGKWIVNFDSPRLTKQRPEEWAKAQGRGMHRQLLHPQGLSSTGTSHTLGTPKTPEGDSLCMLHGSCHLPQILVWAGGILVESKRCTWRQEVSFSMIIPIPWQNKKQWRYGCCTRDEK